MREQKSGILSSIGNEEERIRSIHEELSLENGQLAEERRQVESKEEKLQGKVVSKKGREGERRGSQGGEGKGRGERGRDCRGDGGKELLSNGWERR